MATVNEHIASAARHVPGLDVDRLRAAIREEYATVATEPGRGFHFHTGRPLARLLGYDDAWLDGLPEATVAAFAGTGNPLSLGPPTEGEHVVDVGCGAGIDSLLASRMVGRSGYVVGVDMTPEMIQRARASAAAMGTPNVAFQIASAEALPVPDGWADVVLSNGVLNLFPDKSAGLLEMARVLKPGGRLQVGDIMVSKAVPDSAKRDIDLWKGWIAGALLETELQATVVAAGFVDFEITWHADVFSGAPQASSAAQFGTVGVNFRARKPTTEKEWLDQFSSAVCAV